MLIYNFIHIKIIFIKVFDNHLHLRTVFLIKSFKLIHDFHHFLSLKFQLHFPMFKRFI